MTGRAVWIRLALGMVCGLAALGGAAAAQLPGSAVASAPERPSIAQALASGVLIVVSKASQRMQVFVDGADWLTSPVSTGRHGHRTPAGVFPVLQKARYHRSNLYSNAPMPWMQRLTRGGIAIHGGYVPGYPASHGCIRVPAGAARALFAVTRPGQTAVVVTNAPLADAAGARALALAAERPAGTVVPAMPVRVAAPAATVSTQTIQLAAALSAQEAEAQWARLLAAQPDLARLGKRVVPATVGAQRYFRLRATGSEAYAACARLHSAGIACFRVL